VLEEHDRQLVAKRTVLRCISEGKTIKEALVEAGRHESSYDRWRKTDPDFKRQVDELRSRRRVEGSITLESQEDYDGSFPLFVKKYLGSELFEHQLRILDVVEGREPRNLHPSMTYEPGLRNYALVNVPPEHAKSMTFSIAYPMYRICKDPNIKIIVVSKTKDMAKEFLYGVKQRMTHPRWFELQTTFGNGGFKAEDAVWQSDTIYLGSNLRDSTEKDPTIQAIGMGGQIYGARADLVILDDTVLLGNAQDYEKQIRWIQQDVLTRLGPGGLLLILGTRVDAKDLYSEIIDPERYPDARSPWTVLRMPAVLEFDDDPKKWVTLWPRSNEPWSGFDDELQDEDGYYPRWDGPHLRTRRGVLAPKTWSMVYQQQDVPANGVFDADLVRRAINAGRHAGPLMTNHVAHPEHGMGGMYVLCSLDPAMGGDAGAVAYAVDRTTAQRYVLDARRIEYPTARDLNEVIREWTETYKPNEWRIEKNAFQKYLTQDEVLRKYLADKGVILHEHFTGSNVWDADFGISAMATLFGYWTNDEKVQGRRQAEGCLIELPTTRSSEGVKALVEQLVLWEPKTKNKKDMVMALWFAEIRAKELTQKTRGVKQSFAYNPFATPDRVAARATFDLGDMQSSMFSRN
jgi:hypothetical protein